MADPRERAIIDDSAASWAARSDRGDLTSDEQTRLQEWLSEDIRHLGAYARARTILSSDATGAVDPSRRLPGDHGSRAVWLGAIASVILAMVMGASLLIRGVGYETDRGELRRVPLRDGTVVTMNTDSEIRVRMSDHDRKVELESGETLFEVAPDKDRPFFVHAGRASFRAVGTAFVVRRLQGAPIEITVQEGIVEITNTSGERHRIDASTRAVLQPASGRFEIKKLRPVELDRALSWRDGKIIMTGQSLAEAAAEFNRYNATQIVIPDHSVRSRTVAGRFSANDPSGFVRAVARSMGLRVEETDSEVRLYDTRL